VLGGLGFVQGDETGPLVRNVHIRKDGLDRAFRNTQSAVDALHRIDIEDLVALVEAVDRADFDAIGVLAIDAGLADYVGHWENFSS